MENFISIVSTAYNVNFIDEARNAYASAKRLYRNRDEPNVRVAAERLFRNRDETDTAKIVSFALKLLGSIALGCFCSNVFFILINRTASLACIFFTTLHFVMSADLLKSANNLRFEYFSTDQQPDESGMTRTVLPPQMDAIVGSVYLGANRCRQRIAGDSSPEKRIFATLIKNTYVLAPLYRQITHLAG